MKIGEFELFIKIGGNRMRELVDTESCKTYIITEPGTHSLQTSFF